VGGEDIGCAVVRKKSCCAYGCRPQVCSYDSWSIVVDAAVTVGATVTVAVATVIGANHVGAVVVVENVGSGIVGQTVVMAVVGATVIV